MRRFSYERVENISDAIASVSVGRGEGVAASFMAGGTTIFDLMKLGVDLSARLVDIKSLDDTSLRSIDRRADELRIGALVTMDELCRQETVRRDFPVLVDALALAASGQIRNVATLGGNVLQRTRCNYFRDTSYHQCNKRSPGSGCAAMDGFNRNHAVLGTSEACIATYAGDWAQALVALDAVIETRRASGVRTFPFAALHPAPANRPDVDTILEPGELITGFYIPGRAWRRSRFVKVRDRQSYAFASASAAVALDLQDRTIRDVRIGLGGVASIPWRARRAEAFLRGKTLTEETAAAAAEEEFSDAVTRHHNAFKVPLDRATLVRALLETRDMEIAG
jgi:xanthine dehydrogenase YagS FAD-binding subunit